VRLKPHHLHVPNVMEMWEPKPPGTLWGTPGLLPDSLPVRQSIPLVFQIPGYSGQLFLAYTPSSDDRGSIVLNGL
jgi:hypothetical protein